VVSSVVIKIYIINFQTQKEVFAAILRRRPPNLIYYNTRRPEEILRLSGLTEVLEVNVALYTVNYNEIHRVTFLAMFFIIAAMGET